VGSQFIVSFFICLALAPISARAQYTDDQVIVKKLRTHQDVEDAYCYVETGGHDDDCGAPSQADKLDVVYVPKSFGDRVIVQLQSAYSKKYYSNMSKVDLFHGHFLAKGPQTEYASGAAWFNDVVLVLYHSAEYLQNVWPDLKPGDEEYKEHAVERSFVGWMQSVDTEAVAAITLILPGELLKSYPGAGTIYAEELNQSVQVSQHQLSGFGGNQAWHLTNSCDNGDTSCKPCEIFNMMFMMPDANGRFVTPDGVRIEIFFQCRFRDEYY